MVKVPSKKRMAILFKADGQKAIKMEMDFMIERLMV
jgi:hypothetical protein